MTSQSLQLASLDSIALPKHFFIYLKIKISNNAMKFRFIKLIVA